MEISLDGELSLTAAHAIAEGVHSDIERQFPKVKPTHVVIEYGKPVAYKDLTRDEQRNIDEYFRTKIRDMVVKNKALE